MAGIEGLLIGRVLGGRYRIEEVIGRGGMGAVYRAVDERLGRQVALKVITLAAGVDDDSRERLRARFFREARSAAALPHHPNVVPVYDYGSDEALGLDFLVMELLRGADLATRLARTGPPPLAEALKILQQACQGVAVGHRQGLIHRDVKPGNIFLVEGEHQEVQVRVVDFGIAKLADDEDTLAQLTQDGRVPHSPAYASPEQLRGLAQLTPASDVFSLGAVGFQLLTGERPFTDADRNRLSLGMPAEPASLRAVNPAIPGSIDAVIRRALAFDPPQRFPDAAAMAAELGRAIRSLGETPLEPYPGAATAAAPRTPSAEDVTQLTPPPDDVTQLVEPPEDHTLLAPPPPPAASIPPPARATTPPRQRQPLPPRRREPARRDRAGSLVWALVLLVLGGAAVWGWNELQRPAGIVQIPPPPDTIPIVVPDIVVDDPPDPTLDAFVYNDEGMRLFNQRQYAGALEMFEQAVRIDPLSADYRRNYGLTLMELGRAEEAAEQFESAIRIAPTRADSYFNLARVRQAMGDLDGAIAAYEGYVARETDPDRRAIAEQNLRDLRTAREMPRPAPPPTTPTAPPADETAPPEPPPNGPAPDVQPGNEPPL
jgi:serine/threonine protein kinase